MSTCTAKVSGRHKIPGGKAESECPLCGPRLRVKQSTGDSRVMSVPLTTQRPPHVLSLSVAEVEEVLSDISPRQKSGFLSSMMEYRRGLNGRMGRIKIEGSDWDSVLTRARYSAEAAVPPERRVELVEQSKRMVGDTVIRHAGVGTAAATSTHVAYEVGGEERFQGARDEASKLLYDTLIALEAGDRISDDDSAALSYPWLWASDRSTAKDFDFSPYAKTEGGRKYAWEDF